MKKLISSFRKAMFPFFSFPPFVLLKIFSTRSKIELIEMREWIYASREILERINTSSKLAKYRKKSEDGVLFSSKELAKVSKYGYKAQEVIANNTYLNGGGYRVSSRFAIEKFLAYESNCAFRQLNSNNLVFFGPEWASSIGHSTNLSILPKLESVNPGLSKRVLIYSHAANHFYLSLLAKHYTLCRIPENLKSILVTYLNDCLHPLDAMRTSPTEVLDIYSAMTVAEQLWARSSNSRNFLELPEAALERGNSFLQTTLLASYEWFVVLHMREASTTKARGAGNVEINSYIPAIKEILAAGGAVVRIGNSGMTRLGTFDQGLESNPAYFDYANSSFKSEELDIFLMSNCRFMIGTASGPIFIPKEFGKSVLYTNAPNVGVLPGILGFALPNLYQDTSGRLLSLSEMLGFDEVGWKMSRVRERFIRLPNSGEDIRLATQFMISEGCHTTHDSNSDSLNLLVSKTRNLHRLTSAMPICPTYLSTHDELLR